MLRRDSRRLSYALGTVLAVALVSVLTVWSCRNSRSTPPATPTITIGYQPNIFALPVYVMADLKLLDEKKVSARYVRFDGSTELVDALLRGEINAAGALALPTAAQAELLKPGYLRMLTLSLSTKDRPATRLVVRSESRLKELSDLVGKEVGYSPPSNMTKLISKASLTGASVDPGALTLVPIASNLAIDSLLGGQIDALFCIEPAGSSLIATGKARFLHAAPANTYIMDPLPGVGFFIKRGSAANIDQELRAACDNAIEYIRSHPKEVREILARWVALGDTSISDTVPIVEFLKTTELKRREPLIDRFLGFLHSNGELSNELSADTLIRE